MQCIGSLHEVNLYRTLSLGQQWSLCSANKISQNWGVFQALQNIPATTNETKTLTEASVKLFLHSNFLLQGSGQRSVGNLLSSLKLEP